MAATMRHLRRRMEQQARHDPVLAAQLRQCNRPQTLDAALILGLLLAAFLTFAQSLSR